jgi:cysteine desulfurase family protein (TIGR01976 family)
MPTLQPSTAIVSVHEIRDRFPALTRRAGGAPVAYFDGPGGTQVPRTVSDAVTAYLLRHNANTHWNYPSSEETDEIIAAARGALGDFLGAAPSEIAFGANMTTLTFHLARALSRQWEPGDEIVVTELDHLANVSPWEAAAGERGATVRQVPMDPESGTLDWGALEGAVGARTRVLALGAASNAIGTINDVGRAVSLARSVGATTFVDAVHYAPHALVDVAEWDCDYLACSAYKFYGPHIGVLYGREELVQGLKVPRLECQSDRAPERLETGTLNHEGIAGAHAAVEFLASLANPGAAHDIGTRRARLRATFAELHQRGDSLFRRLWEALSEVHGVRLFGPPPGAPRTPTVGFTVAGVPSSQVARHLSTRWGVFVSHGDFYASNVIRALGLGPEGLVRAGCACYTTEEEVERLVTGVRSVAAGA